MAVQRNKSDKMIIKVITDQDASGKVTYGNRTVSHVNPVMTDDEVRGVGLALGALLTHETDSIQRTINYEIAAE